MPYTDTVDIIKKAFCEGEIVYGIQDISLAYTIITNETIDFGRELKLIKLIILEIGKYKAFKIHISDFGFRILELGFWNSDFGFKVN